MPDDPRHANLRRSLPNSKRVWLRISALMFVAAWLISSGKDGDLPAAMLWWSLITREYTCPTGDIVGAIAFFTLFFGIAATVAGWLLQFPVCLALNLVRSRGEKNQSDFARTGATSKLPSVGSQTV
jgi:hypothetical protein